MMSTTLQFQDRLDYDSRPLDGDYDYDMEKAYKEFKDYMLSMTGNPLDHMYFVLYFKCAINLFCVLGIFCNSVFIVVLTRHGFRETTNLLLAAITVSDIIFFTAHIYHLVAQVANGIFQITNDEALEFFNKIVSPWTTICVTSSLCLVAVMAVERLVAVSLPFLVSRIFTPFRIKLAIGIINVSVIVIVYLNIDSQLEQSMTYKYASPELPAANESCEVTGAKVVEMVTWFDPVLLVLLPIMVILICYVAILLKLQLAAKTLTRLSSGISHSTRANLKRNKLHRMLLVLMTVTLLSFLPPPAFNLYMLVVRNVHSSYETMFQNLYLMLTQVCQLVFSSANSIICVMMSSSFAKTFKKIVCRT